MSAYVALIRGIGPGDPRKTNEKLRGVLESLGYSDVRSVISSGNIVFDSPEKDVHKLEDAIEAAWPTLLGFHATTIVRSQSQLQTIVDANPFGETPHSKESYQLVTFFRRPQKLSFSLPYQPPGKPYTLIGYDNGVLFSTTDSSIMKPSDLMVWMEKQFGKDITSRTPVTIQRILDKMKK